MKTRFNPSVNIERDDGKRIHYIPTPNAESIARQIDEDYQNGVHSFSIIGSYGSGKSSFLWAFHDQLYHHNKHFNSSIKLNGKNNYETLNIVGLYSSFEEVLQKKTRRKKTLVDIIDEKYRNAEKNNNGLIIIVDEFGKHLEFAARNNPEKELYHIQELAEYVNAPDRNILLLITLHQGFETYARDLSHTQRYEWEKVRGRLKEITFNEPVEQLIYLAAEHLSNNKKVPQNFDQLSKSILNSNIFQFRNKLTKKQTEKLYPLDLLSTSVITLALQRYGQNERSLFTFLNSSDPFGLVSFNSENDGYYNLVHVYDYLINNFYSFLSSRYNPDFLSWELIKGALQRAETIFVKDYYNISQLIKVIGLLNIFSSKGAQINEKFLTEYGKHSLGLKSVSSLLDKLTENKLIRYLNFRDSFSLFEGTDVDIEKKLIEVETRVEKPHNIVTAIEELVDIPVVMAKSAYFKYGTPRYFQFVISDEPTSKIPEGNIDGIVNLIFSDKVRDKDLSDFSKNNNEAILFGQVNDFNKIRDSLYEIDKANELLKEIGEEDRIARRELNKLITFHKNELLEILIETIYESKRNVNWFYKGQKLKIKKRYQFNKTISEICDDLYSACPIFDNELMNRSKLPGAISKARRNLISKLIVDYSKEDLGFDDKYPPEKTIYLSLIKRTGIHRKVDGSYDLTKPTDKSFEKLWWTCEDFLESSKAAKRNLEDLFDLLQKKPFKLKRGFIDFWIPLWLLIKRNDFALYKEEQFQPALNSDTFDVILKKPSNYFIKAFDLGGIKLDLFNKYRNLIDLDNEKKPTQKSFIDTIRPFLLFYKDLPDYSKTTSNLSSEANALRSAIKTAKDPEQTFFQDFPNALRFTTKELSKSQNKLDEYIKELHSKIDEIKNSFPELITRIEKEIINSFNLSKKSYPDYKSELQNRYSKVKKHLLSDRQQVIYQRINSAIDDRVSWISSFSQSILNKRLEQIEDKEERIFYDKLDELRLEFDNLLEFSNLNANNQNDIIKLNLTSIKDQSFQQTIQISENENNDSEILAEELRKKLKSDKKKNILALIRLLKEELNEK